MGSGWKNCLLVGVCMVAMIAIGCGSDDPESTGNDNQGWEFDAGTGDTGDPGDAGIEDTGPTEDTGADEDPDAGPDDDADTELPDDAPEAMDDFLVCEADHDCPINGSNCVQEISFNRTDADGTQDIAVDELFDELEEGEGVCTRNCAEDPTVCDTVYWADEAGQAQPSTCLVLATGLEPYEVTSEEPFEVELDFDEMEQGQAFGALCLPPFDHAEGRSETFCNACDVEEDCGDETVCYNALTEDLRQSPDELGDSFCVESCQDQADCPMGFDCAAVGDDGEAASYCLPVEDTCTDCVDRDENGFGTGHCGSEDERQTPFDCDDANPDAYYDPDDMDRPFPDHCYDDPEDERFFYDLNCSGVLDHEEQIGADQYPEEHCTACGDECAGEVDDGHRVCKTDDDGQPYCGVGCEPGFAVCDGDHSDGCPIDIEAEKALGEDQYYRDQESPYIWYDADDGEEWAHKDAEPHFFCSFEEAEAALDNPVQRRGCHPEGEWERHPERTQYCVDVDVTCDGLTGLDDPDAEDTMSGSTYTVGDSCDTGDDGMCAAGTAQCTSSEMVCEQVNTQYPVSTPTCTNQDTTCSGSSDSNEDEFVLDGEELTLLDDDGNELGYTPSTIEVGTPCEVDGELGECRIGEVRCDGDGLYCEQTTHPQPEEPGFDGVDRSCQGVDRYLNDNGDPHVIYVDTSDSSPTLTQAVNDAANCNLTIGGEDIPCDVFVQDSSNLTTTGTIEIEEGVHVYGGWDTSSWDPNSSNFDPPEYGSGGDTSTVKVEFASGTRHDQYHGLRATNIQETTHFYGIELETEDRDDEQGCGIGFSHCCSPNVGAYCYNCEGLDMKGGSITAGAAPRGENAPPGSDGGDAAEPFDDDGAQAQVFINTTSWNALPGGDGAPHDGGHTASVHDNDDQVNGIGMNGEPYAGHGGLGGMMLGDQVDGYPGETGEAMSSEPDTPASPHQLEASADSFSARCGFAHQVENNEEAHGGGGGGSAALCAWDTTNTLYYCGVASGSGGGEAGTGGWGGYTGAPSLGMVIVDTEIDDDGFDFSSLTVNAGRGGAGGDGGDGGDGGFGAGRALINVPFAGQVRGGYGGHGAGGPGGAGGNGGDSIGLLRINSPIGSVEPNAFAGNGGGAGDGGDGGVGGNTSSSNNADDGEDGPQGSQGQTCNHFRLQQGNSTAEFTLPEDLENDGDCL